MKFTNIFSKLFFYSIIFITQIDANQDVTPNDLKAKYLNSNFYLFTDPKDPLYKLFKTQEEFNQISYPYVTIKQETKKKLNQENFLASGKNYFISLDCGLKIPLIHFDRNKETVLVLGGGYMDPKEKLESLAMLFQNYDVVIFDYRTIFKNCKQTKGSTYKKLFEDEKEEIIKTVNFIKNFKKYKTIVGWAECYSCFTFAIAQFEQEINKKPLFDKLIFDSTFPSLKILNESTSSDPG